MADLNRLQQLAKHADKTRANAEDLTRRALTAKREADKAAADYQQALKAALGDAA